MAPGSSGGRSMPDTTLIVNRACASCRRSASDPDSPRPRSIWLSFSFGQRKGIRAVKALIANSVSPAASALVPSLTSASAGSQPNSSSRPASASLFSDGDPFGLPDPGRLPPQPFAMTATPLTDCGPASSRRLGVGIVHAVPRPGRADANANRPGEAPTQHVSTRRRSRRQC